MSGDVVNDLFALLQNPSGFLQNSRRTYQYPFIGSPPKPKPKPSGWYDAKSANSWDAAVDEKRFDWLMHHERIAAMPPKPRASGNLRVSRSHAASVHWRKPPTQPFFPCSTAAAKPDVKSSQNHSSCCCNVVPASSWTEPAPPVAAALAASTSSSPGLTPEGFLATMHAGGSAAAGSSAHSEYGGGVCGDDADDDAPRRRRAADPGEAIVSNQPHFEPATLRPMLARRLLDA